MATLFDNEEKGLPQNLRSLAPSWLRLLQSLFSRSQRAKDVQYSPEPRPSVAQPPAVTAGAETAPYVPYNFLEGPLAVDDKLATFRRITGITSAPEHKTGHRPAMNLGIYARVVKNEREALETFKFSSRLINGCLALQLIVAASLTALGAGDGPHAAVTVFGAVNTIIAGFLTYLKGSGLPNRHKFYASSWRKVREYMEQREREFERMDCPLDVEEVVKKVEHMYEEVRQDVEANEPDKYTSTGQLRRNEGLSPGPQISDRTGEFAHLPGLIGHKTTAVIDERMATSRKNGTPQTLGDDRPFGFNGNKMVNQGPDRLPTQNEDLHTFGPNAPPSVPRRRETEDESNFHLSSSDPVHDAGPQLHAALEPWVEMTGKAKHTEAGIKDELEALTAGIERTGAAILGRASAAVASAVEAESREAAHAVGERAGRLADAAK
ncbi:hypothetical protein MMC19_004925 [Ptychographa xylographoides]|nr:hypothetical protein [Ptychographa xylographoides]